MGIPRSSNILGKITILFVICCCLPAQAKYGGGSGTSDYPYLIYDANQMNAIGADSNDWDKCFKLMADIDLSVYTGTSFNIIGINWDNPFTGVFDGNGHTISNFSYTSTDKSYIGLFGYIGGDIKDLDLVDPNINAGNGNNVGGVVGCLVNAIVSNCRVNGGMICGGDSVGGVVGSGYGNHVQSIIRQCHSNTTVSGRDLVGGLAGEYSQDRMGSLIENSSATGEVFATGNYVGGLVGFNRSAKVLNCYSTGCVSGIFYVGGLIGNNMGTISNCYSTGSVDGNRFVGGLVGDNPGKITNSYSVGSVSGAYDVGGLVGYNFGIVMACFWDIETSGQANSAGGKGKTTAEMQMPNTFIGWTGCGNEGIWALDEGNYYPHLWWEQKPGDPLPAYTLSDFIAGAGTESDPYLIYTADELNMVGLFSCDWDKHFLLCADIDMGGFTGQAFNIIGIDYYNAFSGVFDGNGHTISNFTYKSTEINYIGLFGYVHRYVTNGEIKDLGLIDPNVDAGTGDVVGSLAGYLGGGIISNCYVKGGNVFGSSSVGGLIGQINNAGFVMDCYTETNVTATGTSAGSIVGSVYGGIVTGSYAGGSVTGNTSVGGLIGTGRGCGIKDSYSSNDTYGIENVGGLLGYAEFEYSTLENCYTTGIVSGSKNSGGLIGKSVSSTVSDCYWDIETTGQLTSDGGGAGKTTAQMKDVETYLGWSCETKWTIDEGKDYPRLLWENMPGQIISRPLEVYGGGTGTANDPFLLYTPEQFNSIGLFECDWDKHFKLMADIDIACYTGAEFNVTGHIRDSFRGVFDGNGKRVLNITFDVVGRAYNGIFGVVSGGAEIKNLTIVNPNINTYGYYTGALIGLVSGNNVTVNNCHIVNGTISGITYTGGLVGRSIYSDSIIISKCSTSCNVNGESSVGGLVGFFTKGNISCCLAKGNVTGTGYSVGGLVGEASNPATIDNSFSRGDISGGRDVGGLIGEVWNYWLPVKVIKCYSVGKVQGDSAVGGLIGSMTYPSDVENSFWDVQTSGVPYSDGGIGMTTSQMQTRNMYIHAGWDFMGETANGTDDIWIINEGKDYPKHIWGLVNLVDFDGVNFKDYSFFSDYWMKTDCGEVNDCDGTDFDFSGVVDYIDLNVLLDYWLE